MAGAYNQRGARADICALDGKALSGISKYDLSVYDLDLVTTCKKT